MSNLKDIIEHTVGATKKTNPGPQLSTTRMEQTPRLVIYNLSKSEDIREYELVLKDALEGKAIFRWEEKLFGSDPLRIVFSYIEIKHVPIEDKPMDYGIKKEIQKEEPVQMSVNLENPEEDTSIIQNE